MVTIIIENEKCRAEKYTGKFSLEQDIEEIMRLSTSTGNQLYYTR